MKNTNADRQYHVKGIPHNGLRAAIEMGLSYAVPPVIMVSEPSSDGHGRDWVTCFEYDAGHGYTEFPFNYSDF
jgi:hypothetical protein